MKIFIRMGLAAVLVCGFLTGSQTALVVAPSVFSTLGQAVTLTATVTPQVSTGFVTFYDGAVPLGVGLLNASGTATIKSSLLPDGSHALTARFQGSGAIPPSISSPAISHLVVSPLSAGYGGSVSYPTGSLPPSDIIQADFNNDGIADLATSNAGSGNGTVSVFLGIGDGTFQAAVSPAPAVGGNPIGLAVGDFNQDGNIDIVVANSTSPAGTVSVLLGKGDGTFQPQTTFAVGSAPNFPAVGDFNGDGFADIIVGNSLSGTVSVLLGNGDGTFQTQVTSPAGNNPAGIALGDFNNDGITDVAIANNTTPGTVTILSGTGSGTFTTTQTISVNGLPYRVVAARFNSADIIDLAVSYSSGSVVTVIPRNSDGFFGSANYTVGGTPSGISVGDINGDDLLDIVAANSKGSPFLSVLLGDGAGHFTSGQATSLNLNSSAVPVAIAVGDFNGDGRTDLALADSAQKQVSVSLALIPTTTSLTNVPPTPNPSIFGQTVQLTATVSPPGATGTVTFFVDGFASDPIPVSEGQAQTPGSGFIVGNHSLTATYSGDSVYGASTTAVPVTLTVNPVSSVTTLSASPNPSASGTAVTLTATVTAGASGSVSFYKNSIGSGNLLGSSGLSGGGLINATLQVSNLPLGQTSLIAVYSGDVNFASSTSGSITQAVLSPTTTTLSSSANPSAANQQVTLTASVTSGGTGTITGTVTFSDGATVLGSPVSVAAGSAALQFTFTTTRSHSITAKYSGDANFFASTSAVLTQTVGQPTTTTLTSVVPSAPLFGQVATLTATVSPAPGASPLGVTFYDGATVLGTGPLTGGTATFSTPLLSQGVRSLRARYNGNPTSGASLSSAVAKTVGSGVQSGFDAAVTYTVGSNTSSVAVGDFNGDGIQDIASTGTPSGLDVSGAVNVLFGNGNGTFQAAHAYATSTSISMIAVADMNGDGHQDIVITTPIGIGVLLNTGTGAFGSPVATQTAAGTSLAIADVNGDGIPDAIMATASNVLFLPGVGDGTFGAAQTILTTTASYVVVAADFNNDGNADAAVIDNFGNLNVLLGKGDGTFQPAKLSTVGSPLHSIATGDFNGDGKADIALATNTSANSVVVLLGNGDGTFLAPVAYPVSNGEYVATGDFTGDGILDLAVTDSSGANFKVLPGNGNGTFGAAASSAISASADAIAAGNFHGGDGRGDIVVGYGSARDIGVLLGAHTGLSVSCPATTGQILTSVPYSLACSASGGASPYTYSISAGTLPPPLTLNTSTGAIGGTPNSPGPYTFTVSATDSSAPPQSGTKTVALTVVAQMKLNSSPLPSVAVNTFYSISLVSGGTAPFTCAISTGTLPTGLQLNASTCVLSGTPTAAGVSTFTVGVSDSGSPQQSATQVFSLAVSTTGGGVPTGVQPSGTTAVVLDKSGALVAITSGTAASVAVGTSCASCSDMARDAAGNFIIASGNQLTRITSTGGTLSGGPIPAPEGSSFVSVVIDAGGNYIVADNALHRILRISPDGSSIATVASYQVVDGNVREHAFVRVDSSGNYVLAEDNSAANALALSLFRITSAGTVTAIPVSPSGGGVPATVGGMTFDARGNYVVTDDFRDIIFTITPAGTATPLFLDPNKSLSDPDGIYRDPVSGYYFLVDDANNALYTLAPDGSHFTQILAGGLLTNPVSLVVIDTVPPGTIDYVLGNNLTIAPIGGGSPVACPVTICTSRVFDFAVDASGNFILAAGNALVKITRAGVSSVIAAPSGSAWVSVAVDGSGNFIVADNVQHRVVRISPTGVITPVASYTVVSANQLEDVSVRIDAAGNYIVAEDNGGQVHIFRIAPAGTVTSVTLTGTIPSGVAGLTFDAGGNYVLTDPVNAVIDVITPAGAGSVLFNNANKALVLPFGIYRDPATGRFLITDKSGNALYSLSPDGTQLILVAGQLSGPVAVLSSTLTITTTALPAGTQGQTYTGATLTAAGGSGNYTWTATGLPPGLTITTAGVISGIPGGTSPAQSSVVVSVTDTTTGFTANKTYQLTISPGTIVPPSNPPVSLTGSTTAISTTTGGAVSASFRASGGTPPFTFSATGLPPGVTIDTTGTLVGSPSQGGTFGVNVIVTDTQHVSASASITINVLGLTLTAIPGGTAGQFYGVTLTAAGGTSGYSFTATGLPSGLSLTSYGYLNGTVNTAGSYPFSVTVTSGGLSVSASFTVTIVKPQPLSIPGKTSLADGIVGVLYSQSLSATGGFPPFTWSVNSGSLPQGLSMNAAGIVSGTPGTPGSVTFGVQVTDAAGATVTTAVTIVIHAAPLVITTGSLPAGMNGIDYPQQLLSPNGGVPPYTWTLNAGSSLPPGLALSNSGILGGIPTSAGTFSFGVTVIDAAGTKTTTTFIVIIRPPGADLILTYASLEFSLSLPATDLPVSQTIGIQSTVPSDKLGYTVSVSPPAPWLAIGSGSATPDSLEVLITSAALALKPGDYQATVTTTCTSSSCKDHTQAVTVSLTVVAAPPNLQVQTTLLAFSTSAVTAGPLSQSLYLQNAGGGSIGFGSITCEASWCTTGAPPKDLAGGVVAAIPVTVDPTLLVPGFYRTLVDFTTSAGKSSVPVTLFIAPDGTMTLAPAGLQFNMPAGSAPGNPNGSFLVSVNNPSKVNWNAAVASSPDIPGAGWLIVGTPAGTSSSTQPGTVSFSIDPAAAGVLAPGAYYGRIEITSLDVSNAPQDFEVVLNVTPSTAPVPPDPEPGGLLFITAVGGGVLPPQTVNVYTGSKAALTFQTSAAQSNPEATPGIAWLSVTPDIGSTSVNSPGVTTVSANVTGLKAGIYRGGVSYSLSATAVRTVNVTLIVSSQAPASTAPSAATALSRAIAPKAAGCTPTLLAPAQTGLVNNFSAPAAWPTPLVIQLSDDCGSVVNNGQVVATFSNGDPPLGLSLADPTRGLYSGTWSPRKSGPGVAIVVRASAPGYKDATSQIEGAVVPNPAPLLTPHGTLHSFDPLVGAALAPGTIVAIYGQNLAAQVAQPAAVPLPTGLNATSVIVGGIEAPLYYVSPGQINAQIPFELQPAKQYQVIVSANGALTTPDTVQLSPATPGIAAFTDGSLIAQHGDGSLVTPASPARSGEYLVAYLAGLGGTTVPLASGAPSPGSPLALPVDPPVLTINGTEYPILFAGLTPGLVGLYQMNFQVPAGLPAGNLTLVVAQDGLPSNQTLVPYQP